MPDHIADLSHLQNTYEFTANAQIWPRAVRPVFFAQVFQSSDLTFITRLQLNTAIGGDEDSVYLIVADLGSDSGEGLDFIDGFSFLERFYYVYDVAGSRVGFATTEFTNATTN